MRQDVAKREYVPVSALASVFGVCQETALRWLSSAKLRYVLSPPVPARYFELDQQRTKGKRYLIELASIEEMLQSMYSCGDVPPSVLRALRKLAKPLPR